MAKYMADITGTLSEVQPVVTGVALPASNAADAGKMIQLNAVGRVDETLLPRKLTITGGTATENGYIAILDSTGKLDVSVMPLGVGAEVSLLVASEALTAGNWCNIFATGVRKADATTTGKKAHGFVNAAFAAAATATVFGLSTKNIALTGLTIGAEYWLSTTPGGQTTTAPSAAGNWVQPLGVAEATTAMVFSNVMHGWVKLAP